MVCKVQTVPQGKHNRRRTCECACSCDVYTMCGSCEALHGSCLYSQSNISSGSQCAGLPHWPVCPVKSDELGNEKQVCVKCADLSFIPLPPDCPEPVMLSCVLWRRGGLGRRMSRENRTIRERKQSCKISFSFLTVINLPFYCQSSIQQKQKNISITKVKKQRQELHKEFIICVDHKSFWCYFSLNM